MVLVHGPDGDTSVNGVFVAGNMTGCTSRQVAVAQGHVRVPRDRMDRSAWRVHATPGDRRCAGRIAVRR